MAGITEPKPAPGDYNSIAAQYARAKALKDAEDAAKASRIKPANGSSPGSKGKTNVERLNDRKAGRFKQEWRWSVGFFTWLLFIHVTGIYFFTKGFLLTRLVLEEKSSCADPPIALTTTFKGAGTPEEGCWHQKTFEKAVVIVIDALRYDFTVPFNNVSDVNANAPPRPVQAFHNALPFLYDTAMSEPHNAFLLPFIADPPTVTLQRLKGLTTGTLPTFIDVGSNFAGTAIQEDNLLTQLRNAGKRIVHLGDDTWTALFPGYFEEGISRAYDSFNVWDLHTVDNGVIEHIMPLLSKERKGLWDVMIAHCLGVDHAGHRYGPNHPAMTAKLEQMDSFLRDVVKELDGDTLLVVMGDHGMDGKGDHGGESDDEVEAVLWMYSKKGVFGRTDPAYITPPATAKIRPLNQIDLVPTLALLLGLPIPFNNLGRPIEEAFAGKGGSDWENLAGVVEIAAAGIKRYQAAYYKARGLDESAIAGSPLELWKSARDYSTSGGRKDSIWKGAYLSFSAYQEETLRICRSLWASFDVPCMILGVSILVAGVAALVLYAAGAAEDISAVDDPDLDQAERQLELESLTNESPTSDSVDDNPTGLLFERVLLCTVAGAALGPVAWVLLGKQGSLVDFSLATGSIGGLLGVLYLPLRFHLNDVLPTNVWGWLAVLFTVSQSIGFASNSYTIWEDSILLFFISTFGLVTATSSLRIQNLADRTLGVYHSGLFIALGWIASFSKLCREEQMPYCKSTYYSSATTSTSAPWQLLIPFTIAIFLPFVIKSYYMGSRSYEGFAPIWISWAFRGGLMLSAVFWILDAADDADWLPNFPAGSLKKIRVPIAQTVFALSLAAGTTAFGWATPCVSIKSTTSPTADGYLSPKAGATITILGYANTHGARYFLLVINILLAVLIVQKPMGAGAIALMAWQILSLLEVLDLNSLTSSSIGPTVLALLGSFYFFKTGHQATLSSIQWESAFIPLHSIRYPYSPVLVALNTFGAQMLAVTAVPCVALWKQKPRKQGLMRAVARALACHAAYYAVIGLATTMWAGHLRRHLMLFRIFSPKFMAAGAVLIVIDLVGILVALIGVRRNELSVGEVFGWG